MSNKKYLKHFVRYDGSGKLIPGGNIRAPKAPRVGTWVEVNDNECCNPTTTSTTTIAWPEGDCFTVYLHGNIVSGTVWELRYCGETRETVIYSMEMPEESVCVNQIPVLVSGIGTWDLGETCTTTTTTLCPDYCDYGLLYNWFAVDTSKLAPTGYHVPTDTEFETLRLYVASQGWNYDGTTDAGTSTDNKQGKALASICKWTFDATVGVVGNTDYPDKRNISGFSSLPSGYRGNTGYFGEISTIGIWWSSTKRSASNAWSWVIQYSSTFIYRDYYYNNSANSVRCIRDSSEGWIEGEQMEDYDGNLYDTVQIGTQIWTVQNLKVTRYNDGEAIPNVTDNTEWDALTTGACCAYNNDWDTYACVAEPTTTTTTTTVAPTTTTTTTIPG